jgi:DNA-binding transcriptional regulator YdaS (Cro superfamily)
MEKHLTRFEALKLAISRATTQKAFAESIGISGARVSQLIAQSKQLPAEYVLTVERIYGVSRHNLRPDIYPRSLAQMVDLADEKRFYGVDTEMGHAA